MLKKSIIITAVIISACLISGCYNKGVKRPNDELLTKPTTDFTVFKSKF